MKTKKFTAITLMLAAAAVTSVFGGVMLDGNLASADAQTYALTDIFSATQKDDISAETVGDKNVTAFTLGDDEVVWYKRNLAYTWYTGANQANYFSMEFAFKTLDFKSVTLKMDAPSVWATQEEKATNTITFTPVSGGLSVSVNGNVYGATVAYTAGNVMTLSLAAGDDYGEFKVQLDNNAIGTFTNVGANYATYSLNETHPIEFTMDFGEKSDNVADKNATIYLYSVNGQSFDGVNADGKVTDDAAPVLVVNEDIEAFQLGSAFSLDYKVIDVLQTSNFPSNSTVIEYYQYNPTNEVETDEFTEFKNKNTLTTSTNFFHTVYKDGDVTKSVFDVAGEEYVAIRFSLGDSTFTGDDKVTYDLAWYMSSAKQVDTSKGLRASDLYYIPINENDSGPKYTLLTADTDDQSATYQTNVKATDYATRIQEFNDGLLAAAAKNVYAGSNSYINFPSFDWLIEDNGSYGSMKFTVSYKTQYATSASTSSGLSPNSAKISVSKEGVYEFKIFATDAAGNAMQYYLNGELVDVTSSNVWEIEEIPFFTFTIENRGLKLADSYSTASSRKDTEVLEERYTMDDLKVVGATDLKEAYALYKVNSFTPFNETVADTNKHLRTSDLALITYEEIAARIADKKLSTVTDGDYFKFYLEVYAELLAEENGLTPTPDDIALIVSCFEKIGEAGDRINSEEKYEKYEWSSSSQSFQTVEEGNFLVVADYWEGLAASSTRAMAYRVVTVESKKAVISGENDWLKNNVVSVVLFAIAGVMLVMIIILLMIKPSDETLEDLDKKVVSKKAKKKQTK